MKLFEARQRVARSSRMVRGGEIDVGRLGSVAQRAHSEQWSGSVLRGVLLALLLDEHNRALNGYRLAILVRRRLGPAWDVGRQSVYRTLEQLEKEDLVSCAERSPAGMGGAGRRQRVYWATDRAEAALSAWMEAPVSRELVRDELQAKIAISRARDAPALLRALDAYERSCFELLRQTGEAKVPMGSWAGLSMNLARAAADEGIEAELRWVAVARRWIADYIAEQAMRPPR